MTRTPSPNDANASAGSTNCELQRPQQLSAKGPPHTAMEDATTALDRRRRHREKIMRYRRKKKATGDEMKLQEQWLAAQLCSMLDLHASQSQTYNQRQVRGGDGEDPQLQQSPTAMDALVSALTEKEHLHEENTALRQHIEEYHKLHESLEKTLEKDREKQHQKDRKRLQFGSGQSNSKQSQGDSGCWLQFLSNEALFYYSPLSALECNAYVTRTLESVFSIQSIYLSGGFRGAHVATLFGWTASLLLEFDEGTHVPMIRYEFKKTFQNSPRTIEELVEIEWQILHSPGLYQSIHRVPIKSKVLQRVNEDLSVVMWNAPDPEQSLRYRNVSVFSRNAYQNPEGHACQQISMTATPLKSIPQEDGSLTSNGIASVPPPQVTTAEGKPVVYVAMGFLYTTFTHGGHGQQSSGAGENEIHASFGGHVSILSEEQERFLMVELGGTCVRLEHLLFPFRVLGEP